MAFVCSRARFRTRSTPTRQTASCRLSLSLYSFIVRLIREIPFQLRLLISYTKRFSLSLRNVSRATTKREISIVENDKLCLHLPNLIAAESVYRSQITEHSPSLCRCLTRLVTIGGHLFNDTEAPGSRTDYSNFVLLSVLQMVSLFGTRIRTLNAKHRNSIDNGIG